MGQIWKKSGFLSQKPRLLLQTPRKRRPVWGPERPLWGPERPLWGPQRLLWGPERPLWRPQRRLWRPNNNEDSSIKMKGFGSNLFNLMELSLFFGRNRVPGGFLGVLRAAGTFSGQKRPLESARKIQFGLNRTLRQRIVAILTHMTPTAPPVPVGCLPALFDQKTNKNHDFGPWGPWGPPWAPAALRDLREAHCTLVLGGCSDPFEENPDAGIHENWH